MAPAAERAHAPPLIVACLCAAWCSSCREYRATFDRVASQFAGVRFDWVDVEEDAALVDGIDVEDFPTLLIVAGGAPRFFGALTPQPEVLTRLVRSHLDDATGRMLDDRALAAVVTRLEARMLGEQTSAPACRNF